MRGMLNRERAHMNAGECTEENLLTALIRAEELQDEKESRKMDAQEVMGNAFIFLFAGHETTANTLHYALLLLAQHPDVQQSLLNEIDDVYDLAAREGRSQLEYELDFNRARWTFAIMVCKNKNKNPHAVAHTDFVAAVGNTSDVYPDWHDKQMDCDRPADCF